MPLTFNAIPVAQTSHQKHLGFYVDEKLNFNHHIKEIISKVDKEIGIIRKLRIILSRNALLNIYKSFIKPNVDNCDFIYGQPHIMKVPLIILRSFKTMLLLLWLVLKKEQLKIYEKLGLGIIEGGWIAFVVFFYKIKPWGHSEYLYKLILAKSSSYNTHNSNYI